LSRKRHIFVCAHLFVIRVTLCRCKTDPFASFSQPPRPPISPEESLIPSSASSNPPSAPVVQPTFIPCARARSPAVCTRKRRGDGKHVCAMRTGIGVSLFRGGSDVLFHPRRRQSCRTAKTYHTIVSKFAHSLISRSFLRCLFFSPFSFAVFHSGSPAAFSLSSLVLPYHFLFLVLFVFLYFTFFFILFIAILSLVHPVSAEGSRDTRRQNFSPFRLRAGPEDIR